MKTKEEQIQEKVNHLQGIEIRSNVIQKRLLILAEIAKCNSDTMRFIRIGILMHALMASLRQLQINAHIVRSMPIYTKELPLGGVTHRGVNWTKDRLAPYAPIWKWDNKD